MVLFAFPIGQLLAQSVWSATGPTVENFRRLVSEPLYIRVLWRTLSISLSVTGLCAVLGFPVAFWLTRLKGGIFAFAITCVFLPLWTSVLARIYSWAFLMQKNGIVSSLLMHLHLINAPLSLLYTDTAVVVVMTHVLLPFMISPSIRW